MGHHASGVCRLDYWEGETLPGSNWVPQHSSPLSRDPILRLQGLAQFCLLHEACHPKPVLSPPKPVTLCLAFPTPSSPTPPPPRKCNITSLAFQASGRSSKVTLSGPLGPPLVVILLSSLCLSPGPQVCSFGRETSVEGAAALAAAAKLLQLCPTLCDLMDCSLPGSSVHGIFQARGWVTAKRRKTCFIGLPDLATKGKIQHKFQISNNF